MKINRMTAEEFWPVVQKNSAKVFKSQNYAAYEQMTAYEKSTHPMRTKFLKERVEIFFGLFDSKNKVVGWSGSVQLRPNELYMVNSAVLEEYRGKGWYSKLAKETIKEARKLGFQVISSNHISTNNLVIMAKLKLGFVISGLEILDEVGSVLKMSYFLSPDREEVFRYRTGETYPSPKVKRLLKLK